MENKNLGKYSLQISIAIIIIFLVGAFFLFRSKPVPTSSTDGTNTTSTSGAKGTTKARGTIKSTALVDGSLISEETLSDTDPYAKFDVTYPQFDNASAELNDKIKNDVTTSIIAHKKDSADNWQARYNTRAPADTIAQFPAEADKYLLTISWKPVQVNKQFISILVTTSGFTGGAHGYVNMVSYNYDVVKKQDVMLASLFPTTPNYLVTLSDFSRKNLEAQFRKSLAVKTAADEKIFQDTTVPTIVAGTVPITDNFSIFTFTPTTITIYFAQYQVGPYVMGEPTVAYPRK